MLSVNSYFIILFFEILWLESGVYTYELKLSIFYM